MDINKFNHVSNYHEQMYGKNGRLTLFFLCFKGALTITSTHALTISLRMDLARHCWIPKGIYNLMMNQRGLNSQGCKGA